ncbi:MAG: Yip1 family protein [Acidobacteriia bacterium]|nr:Yip1 family protein [Terriglobia bacterium]
MSQNLEEATLPPVEGPNKSMVQRIVGVLFSPKSTFEDINRKPDWLIPLILIVLVTLAATYVFMSHADIMELLRAQIEKSGRTPPPDEALAGSAKYAVIFSYISIIVFVPVGTLVVAGVLFMIFSFIMGAETTYKKMFSVTVYASITGVVRSLIAIPILFTKQPTEFGNPADVVQSNLGFLFDPAQKALHALGKSLDIFTVWYIVVMSIGIAAISKGMAQTKALVALIILWILVICAVVGWAAWRG